MEKPTVTKSNHILPFGELSPAQFERLCLWLVVREGYLRPEHLGEAGGEQGRDVIAYHPTSGGEQLWYFQCKRYRTISAAVLIDEVEKYNQLVITEPIKKPFGIVFVTNATLSADARDKVRAFCAEYGYVCEFWARTELDMRVKKHVDLVAEFFNLTPPTQLSYNKISVARLPVTGPALFGRAAELQQLDEAWSNSQTNIITFVAWGGVGKTALVNHWLKRRMALDHYGGAERVYGWSFYSQGTSDRAASADLFIDQGLRWFGDPNPTEGSPWDKGERLARLIRETRTLLILDGLEPLQHPPGPQEGRLKDAALQVLLVELAAHQPGLCVVTTRVGVGDLVEFENGTVLRHELEHLTPQVGAQLLRAQQVIGDTNELEQAAMEYGGHALALTLLGSYLADVYGGDIRRRGEIEDLGRDVRFGGHTGRVMRAYEKWLGEGVELAVLRLLGLFDRPADPECIAALRAAPTIEGLTEALQGLPEARWQQSLSKLHRIKLITSSWSSVSTPMPDVLDAHPLVREHFREQLKRGLPSAWREANNRLYEHFTRMAKEFPDTTEDMSLLYAAVVHGCEAERYQEVWNEVYLRRIQRMDEAFSIKKLGLFGFDLAALKCFFETPWSQPVLDLDESSRAFALSAVGFNLRALGRLKEAINPMKGALESRISLQDWKNAATNANNLSEVLLIVGDLSQALEFARQSVSLADRSGDSYQKMSRRTTLADVLHRVGQLSEAETIFLEAENIQKERQPNAPILHSWWGFRYCDLLISQGRYREVENRVLQTAEWVKSQSVLLAIALDTLLIGRVHLLQVRQHINADYSQAKELLSRAVDELRQTGMLDFLPLGLLARAQLYRLAGNYPRAESDLNEVIRIATRGEMGLHLADSHLEFAWLLLAQGNWDEAREHWATAQSMIRRMGYRRRDDEISELARRLG